MTIADTVYYEDQDIRITGKELVLYKRPYWINKIQSSEITAMQVLEAPLPSWAVAYTCWESEFSWQARFLGGIALAVD